MAYNVYQERPEVTGAPPTPPWAGNYFPWYVSGKYAWREPCRKEDAGGMSPCRTWATSAFFTSGIYMVPGVEISPLTRRTA